MGVASLWFALFLLSVDSSNKVTNCSTHRPPVWVFFTSDLQDGKEYEKLTSENVLQWRSSKIKAIGVHTRTVSKWLNAVSIQCYDEVQLNQIKELPFVSHVQNVAYFRRLPANNNDDKRAPDKRKRSSLDEFKDVDTEPVEYEESDSTSSYLYAPQSVRDLLFYGYSYNQLSFINIIKAHEHGYTGRNIKMLVLDSGFNRNHMSIINSNIKQYRNFIEESNLFYTNQPREEDTQYRSGYMYPNTQDNSRSNYGSHGTGVVSIIAGRAGGNLIGGAYDVDVYLGVTEISEYELPIEEDFYVSGLEWGEELGVHIISSSLGYYEWWNFSDFDGNHSPASRAVEIAEKKGMIVVTAIGNYGTKTIAAPADSVSCISVGSSNWLGTPSTFSSVGPTADGRMKPEVIAVGEQIYQAQSQSNQGFTLKSGTSFSTPLVASGVALILQAHPKWTPAQVREALIKTARYPPVVKDMYLKSSRSMSGYNNDQTLTRQLIMASGWGIVDIWSAINYVQTDCAGGCKNGRCINGNCVCESDFYNLNCDMKRLSCDNWCDHGRCYNNQCLCSDVTPSPSTRCVIAK
eukprot:TRINITY_DN718_c0_g1_i1.p1 TRINITY_DN718_c0_g1~~TRINITY_DN718_c0_g1_i1.p1  ORF type:complete len:574 (+),score=64.63 TRINITY_DN718_c0_g1_i1:1059-2780(+)